MQKKILVMVLVTIIIGSVMVPFASASNTAKNEETDPLSSDLSLQATDENMTKTLAEETSRKTYTVNGVSSSENQINGMEIHGDTLYLSTYLINSNGNAEISGHSQDLDTMEPVNSPLSVATLNGQNSKMDLGFSTLPVNDTTGESYGEPNRRLVFHSLIGDGSKLVNDGSSSGELYSSKLNGTGEYTVVANQSSDGHISGYRHINLGGEKKVVYFAQKGWPNEIRMRDMETGNTKIIGEMGQSETVNPGQVDIYKMSGDSLVFGGNRDGATHWMKWLYYNNSSGSWGVMESPTMLGDSEDRLAFGARDSGTFNNQILLYQKGEFESVATESCNRCEPDTSSYLNNADEKIPLPEGVSTFNEGFYESGKYFFVDYSSETIYVYDTEKGEYIASIEEPYPSELGTPNGFESFTKDGYIHYSIFKDNTLATMNSSVPLEGEVTSPFTEVTPSSYNGTLINDTQNSWVGTIGWSYVTGVEAIGEHLVIGGSGHQLVEISKDTDFASESIEFDGQLNNHKNSLPSNPDDTYDSHSFTAYNTENGGEYFSEVEGYYAWAKSDASQEENPGTLFTTEGGFGIIDDGNGNIGAEKAVINEKDVVVYVTYDSTHIYYPESGETEKIANSSVIDRYITGTSDSLEAYAINDNEIITSQRRSDKTIVIDRETNETTEISNAVLEVKHGNVVMPTSEGIEIYNADTFVDRINENGLTRTFADRILENPGNVGKFDTVDYFAGYWFFGDMDSEKMYVFDRKFENVESGFTNAVTGVNGEGSFQMAFYESDDKVSYITGDDESEIEIYNTGLETNYKTACIDYLQPNQLQDMSEADNVCWIPIYTGIDTLGTVYQWLILALMIAMPIARETKSDIATMATIDGVLLIAMLIGPLSPGYVAIALITTILLSVYGKGGTDVEINNMGNGGI